MDENRVTYFAETDSRNKRVPFGIKAKDRTRHVYTIGKTGMGKSTLLENMAIQDIANGEGLAFIDPHGKTAELLLEYIPEHRIKDVLYFAPFDLDFPVSFNVLEDVGPDKRHLVVSGLMSAFKKLFGEESFSDRMQYILQNTILALLEYPGATMLGINRMLTDKAYRAKVVANVTDSSVKSYWTQEFAAYTERFAAEATPAIQNKIGQFTSNPLIRNIVGQPKSTFDLRTIMDQKKILIINLSKGRVGEANANLLGSMLITKIYLAAMSRADASQNSLSKLPNFYLYVDEFQSFANESFADILSEARKYKLNLTIAHQYIEQMSEEVRAAVFGNVGTMIAFRVGAFDAETLEKEFAPQFTAEDLVNLGFVQVYMKLMIDGISSQPFSATTLPPIPKPAVTYKDEIIDASRGTFARQRLDIEQEIRDWHQPMEPQPRSNGGSNRENNNGPRPERSDRPDFKRDSGQRSQDRGQERNQDRNQDRNHDSHKDSQKDLRSALSSAMSQKVEEEVRDNKERRENSRPPEIKRSKAPTEQNVSALRSALGAILKEEPKQAGETIAERPAENSAPMQSIPKAIPKEKINTNEVPENILRTMLHVERSL